MMGKAEGNAAWRAACRDRKECKEAQVRILPGNEFYEAQERMRRYLLGVDEDRMLCHFRKASGRDTLKAESLGGWEAPEGKLKGHTTGHYLSALALCYHAVGDERAREKALYVVGELGKCQGAFSKMEGIGEGFLSGYSEEQFDLLEQYTPYPTIWAPYYTLHKILAGLLDCFLYLDSEEALEIAQRLGLWVWRRLSRLSKGQRDKMWGMYIAGEFGGMNATLTQLAGITGREELLQCARLFDNDKLLSPLEKGLDELQGLHANQHIPQILGAVELYKCTGEQRYLKIAENFWTTVTENRAYACGGVGEEEMFRGFREIAGRLTEKTQETCASYNMLKLTKELYKLRPSASYMDYYENALYNHILATQAADESGESTYFFPLRPGARRRFLFENSCCHGTGMESHFKYREGIYHRRGNAVYINLYVPSEIRFADSAALIRIERISKRNQLFRILASAEGIETLYLRKPGWAVGHELRDGKGALDKAPDAGGYLALPLGGGKEHAFWIRWEQDLRFVPAPDEPEKMALQYGPYVMAALSEREDFLRISAAAGEEPEWEEDGDAVHFTYGGFRWVPLHEVGGEAYHVYSVYDKSTTLRQATGHQACNDAEQRGIIPSRHSPNACFAAAWLVARGNKCLR